MREIAPGLWHWTARHPHIGSEVSSYYLADERVALDPLLPAEGFDWFTDQREPPEHVLLTNRHHDRDSWRLRERFGSEVHCVAAGADELRDRGPVAEFQFGDELPGGVVAYEVGAICPDETALHIPAHAALVVADGIIRGGDGLSFVPDFLMDEPEQTKRGLRDAYRALCELDFELLLSAHGDPVTVSARRELREFVGG